MKDPKEFLIKAIIYTVIGILLAFAWFPYHVAGLMN